MLLPRTFAWATLLLSFCSINVLWSLGSLSAQTIAQKIEGLAPSRLPPQPTPIMQELGLTRQQVEQITAIRNRSIDQIERTGTELRQAEQDLEALLASPTATENEVREKFRQVESLRQKLSELTFESRFAMRAVLTPQQRREFFERF